MTDQIVGSRVASSGIASAQASASKVAVPVTVENFVRAETDMYFVRFAKEGGFGRFEHLRDLPLGEATGVRPNRDTL